MEVPAGTNITAAALEALDIPRGLHRLLFRTDNTKRGLMCQLAFDPSYTAFTLGGSHSNNYSPARREHDITSDATHLKAVRVLGLLDSTLIVRQLLTSGSLYTAIAPGAPTLTRNVAHAGLFVKAYHILLP